MTQPRVSRSTTTHVGSGAGAGFDVYIDGTEALAAVVSATVEQARERFSEHVTRVEIHLSDQNGGKSGQRDQRCMLDARLEGR